VRGKLVQFNSEYFEGDIKEYGCGVVLCNPHPHPRPLGRPPSPRPRVRRLPTSGWVEVLWTDGQIYEEWVNYLKEIE